MKKILLLSDTHSYVDDQILKYVRQADEVWHAGDIGQFHVAAQLKALKPLRAVYGNIDDSEVRMEFPLDLKFTLEGVSVWMTHIGGYPNKYNQRIRKEIQEQSSTTVYQRAFTHSKSTVRPKIKLAAHESRSGRKTWFSPSAYPPPL